MDRGVTVLEARGGLSGKRSSVLLSVLSKRELPVLEEAVHTIDPQCFMVVSPVAQVSGRGFSLDKRPEVRAQRTAPSRVRAPGSTADRASILRTACRPAAGRSENAAMAARGKKTAGTEFSPSASSPLCVCSPCGKWSPRLRKSHNKLEWSISLPRTESSSTENPPPKNQPSTHGDCSGIPFCGKDRLWRIGGNASSVLRFGGVYAMESRHPSHKAAVLQRNS